MQALPLRRDEVQEKMKKLKIILLSLLITVLSSQMISCRTEEKIYAFTHLQAVEWMEANFIKNHRLKSVYYPGYGYSNEKPSSYTYLIKDQEGYDEIFRDSAPKVDFTDYMVILHIRSSMGTSGDLSIKDATLQEDGTVLVTVERRFQYTYPDDFCGASAPTAAYFMLVIERQNATSAEVRFVMAE